MTARLVVNLPRSERAQLGAMQEVRNPVVGNTFF